MQDKPASPSERSLSFSEARSAMAPSKVMSLMMDVRGCTSQGEQKSYVTGSNAISGLWPSREISRHLRDTRGKAGKGPQESSMAQKTIIVWCLDAPNLRKSFFLSGARRAVKRG